jgi:hypothetical protein
MTTVALLTGRTTGKARFLSPDKATSTTSQSAYTAKSVRTDDWTKNGRGFSLIPYDVKKGDRQMDMVINNLVEMIRTWKQWKADPRHVPGPDFIKHKFAKYDPGILGLAVQAAVARGIISDDEGEELL